MVFWKVYKYVQTDFSKFILNFFFFFWLHSLVQFRFTERGLTGPVPQFASIQTMQAALGNSKFLRESLRSSGRLLATGMGTAAAHVLITYSSVLFDAVGPGALFAHSCPGISLFFLSGARSHSQIFLIRSSHRFCLTCFSIICSVLHRVPRCLVGTRVWCLQQRLEALDGHHLCRALSTCLCRMLSCCSNSIGILFTDGPFQSLFNVTALCGVSVLLGAGISAATAYFAVLSCQSTTSAWRRGAVNSSAYSEVPISAPTGEKWHSQREKREEKKKLPIRIDHHMIRCTENILVHKW